MGEATEGLSSGQKRRLERTFLSWVHVAGTTVEEVRTLLGETIGEEQTAEGNGFY